MTLIQVKAVAVGPENFLVECSDCGPIGSFTDTETDEVCIGHLESHSVDTAIYRERQHREIPVEDETIKPPEGQ